MGRQRQNSSTSVPCYSRFGTQPSYRHNDESAEVQRAIALSLSSSSPSSSSRRNNVLDCGLTQRQLNDLMNRELTPEDYELLLSLDEGVAKKTVEKSALDSFASRSATPHDVEDSACTISFLIFLIYLIYIIILFVVVFYLILSKYAYRNIQWERHSLYYHAGISSMRIV